MCTHRFVTKQREAKRSEGVDGAVGGAKEEVASIISSSIQPLQNPTLVKYIGDISSPDETLPWTHYHIRKGFTALEKLLINYAGKYATGDEIYMADLYLAPQLHNAIDRYKLDMTEFPLLAKLNKTYRNLPSFQKILSDTQYTGKSAFDHIKLPEA